MNTIPREIWLHIFSFLGKKHVGDDFDIESQLYKEYSYSWYYPVNELYKTSRLFSWLREYEFIHFSDEDYYSTIKIVDINDNPIHLINLSSGRIMGYKINDNENLYESFYFAYKIQRIREINGEQYYEPKYCNRSSDECHNNCLHCYRLNIVEKQILDADNLIREIIEDPFGDEPVLIRPKSNKLNNLKIEYDPSCLE